MTSEGSLPDGHLVFVHELDHRKGMRNFGDGTQKAAVFVVVDFAGRSRGVVGGGIKGKSTIAGVRVGGIGDHHRTVATGPAGDDQVGARMAVTQQSQERHSGKHQEYLHFHGNRFSQK